MWPCGREKVYGDLTEMGKGKARIKIHLNLSIMVCIKCMDYILETDIQRYCLSGHCEKICCDCDVGQAQYWQNTKRNVRLDVHLRVCGVGRV